MRYNNTVIKAIIFDCYGVLLGQGFWHTYAAAGGDVRTDEDFIHKQLHAMNAGDQTSEQFDENIANHLNISLEQWQATKYRQELPNAQLFHYIEDELKPRYKIGMISNASAGSVERKLSAPQLKLFDIKVISAEVGLLKPDRQIYELAAEKLRVGCSECIFVDDYPSYVEAAQVLGMQGIVYKDFQVFKAKAERYF